MATTLGPRRRHEAAIIPAVDNGVAMWTTRGRAQEAAAAAGVLSFPELPELPVLPELAEPPSVLLPLPLVPVVGVALSFLSPEDSLAVPFAVSPFATVSPASERLSLR